MSGGSDRIELAREAAFLLGGARVHPSLRTFSGAAGGEETLEPRVMQVLVALARSAGQVVSRNDLVDACWDGRVVGEDAIQRAVAKVRKLGEDSSAFEIETIPRVGYRLTASAQAAAPTPTSAPLLAVLPFENFSADPEMSFFADAVADEILQSVARGSRIAVIGRASSFQFRGPDKAANKVAAQLGVSHILDGTVRRVGARLRIGVELIEAVSGRSIWREDYERPATDLAAVQEEIAAATARTLGHKFQAPPGGDIDTQTYERYLRLRDSLNGPTTIEQSEIESADSIVKAAPNFASAWALAAGARQRARLRLRPGERSQTLFEESRTAAKRAHELDPTLPDALMALAGLLPICGHYAERYALFKRAADLDTRSSALAALAYELTCTGRLNEALSLHREAWLRDPLDPAIAFTYGEALGNAGRYDDLVRMHMEVERRWPGRTPAAYALITSAAAQGDWALVDEVRRTARFEQVFGVQDAIIAELNFVVDFYRNPTQAKRERVLLALEEGLERMGRAPFTTIGFAARNVSLDAAYHAVERSSFALLQEPGALLEWRELGMHVLFNRSSVVLRSDPRFVRLCARLGLVDYWIEHGWPDCADQVPYDFRAEARKQSNAAGA